MTPPRPRTAPSGPTFSDYARKLLVAQLLATRDTLLATVAQTDASLLALGVDIDTLGEPAPSDVCDHPAEHVVNHHTTLDDQPDDYECRVCGARQSEPFQPDSPT